MKFTLDKQMAQDVYWNGVNKLPDEINVVSQCRHMAEFELLSVICGLHEYLTAYDIMVGSQEPSQKDNDMNSVLNAFFKYISPNMPLSNYNVDELRI